MEEEIGGVDHEQLLEVDEGERVERGHVEQVGHISVPLYTYSFARLNIYEYIPLPVLGPMPPSGRRT